MKKTVVKFKNGDFVFAKVRGHRPWPAKVMRCNKNKYSVYFYGTGETANVLYKHIFAYKENKEKFANVKTIRRAIFSEGINAIEIAINGVDSAPVDIAQVTGQSMNADEDEAESTPGTIQEASANENPGCISEIKNAFDGMDLAPVDIAQVSSASVAKQSMNADDDEVESPPVTIQEASANENLERSVSHKAEAMTACHVDVDAEEVSPPQKKLATPDKKVREGAMPTATVTSMPFNIDNDLLIVYLPMEKCVGIKLNHNKPESFNKEETEEWMKQSLEDAMALKMSLETGQVKIDSIMDRIVVDPTPEEISNQEKTRFREELISIEDTLLMERKFVQLSHQIRNCLCERPTNMGICLNLLEQFKELKLNKLMLLRNPECVDVIRSMRHYEGNLNLWFELEPKKIMNVAKEIYQSFKILFGNEIAKASNFLEGFRNKVKMYQICTKNINKTVLITMTEKSYDKMIEAAENASTGLTNDEGN